MARTTRGSPRSPNYHFQFLIGNQIAPLLILLLPHRPLASQQLMDHRKQQQRESPSTPRSGGGGGRAASSGGKGAKAGGGGKKPIKVVYISNPMRVKTSAAGFRALVQELTGRDADPSKYSTDDDGGGAAQELSPEGSAAAPGTVAAGYQLPDAAAAFNNGGEEGYVYGDELLDNDYAVFSPSTLLYDYPPHSNKV